MSAEPSVPPPPKPQPSPGWKTTEFWGSLAASVLPWVVPSLPHTWQIAITAGSQAVYALARGLAKLGI